jgi:hypothetical protein
MNGCYELALEHYLAVREARTNIPSEVTSRKARDPSAGELEYVWRSRDNNSSHRARHKLGRCLPDLDYGEAYAIRHLL